MPTIHIDEFSVGLDDLTQKQARDSAAVLRVLHRAGRFSVFEATANDHIARTMDLLCRSDLITTDNSCGFPWTRVKLTEKGQCLIGEHVPMQAALDASVHCIRCGCHLGEAS